MELKKIGDEKQIMKDLYPNPCSEGGSLKVDPYNKNYLE
jgi:hypothetical protein